MVGARNTIGKDFPAMWTEIIILKDFVVAARTDELTGIRHRALHGHEGQPPGGRRLSWNEFVRTDRRFGSAFQMKATNAFTSLFPARESQSVLPSAPAACQVALLSRLRR